MVKISIYIDNSNFLNTLKETTGNLESGGIKVDYCKLCKFIEDSVRNYLKDKDTVYTHRVYLYDGIVTDNEEKKRKKESFIHGVERKIKNSNCLPSSDFQAKLSEIKLAREEHLKGDDIHLAIDALLDTFETVKEERKAIVIISGDGDFHPLIKKIKEIREQKSIEVKIFVAFLNKNFSLKLQKEADYCILIEPTSIKLEESS